MKAFALLLTLALFTARAGAADNLIINGNFATGTLAPWTSTGTVSVTAQLCIMGGLSSIEQTVPTTVGARYYLAGSGATGSGVTIYSVRATPAAGGPEDAALEVEAREGSFRRFSTLFTATAASTRISIAVTESDQVGIVDNFVLQEIVVPSRFAGTYSGTVAIELKGDAGARTRSRASASAEVDQDGKIVLLEGTSRVHGGILFDDDAASFLFAGRDNVAPVVASKGRNLSLEFIEALSPSEDEGHQYVPTTRTLTFKLKLKVR